MADKKIDDTMRLNWLIANGFGFSDRPDGERGWFFKDEWLKEPLTGISARQAIDAAIKASRKTGGKKP